MTLATMMADYLARCLCRLFMISALVSITTGLIVLGLYSAFFGTIHIGSVVLGVVLFNVVRASMLGTAEKVEDNDNTRSP